MKRFLPDFYVRLVALVFDLLIHRIAGSSQTFVKLTKDRKVISLVACVNPPSQMYVTSQPLIS